MACTLSDSCLKKTKIPISTLRYYDEVGILKPAQVADSGYRYYSNEELRILHHITALKELGATAYAVWTGIGTVGAAVVGMFFFHESKSWLRILCILGIIVSVVGLKNFS